MTEMKQGKQALSLALPDSNPLRSGKRKSFSPVPPLSLRWPSGADGGIARYEFFDAYHGVAMQILHRAKVSFRLAAIFKIVINWKTGTIRLSSKQLAERAGNCSTKTIERDIKQYERLGLLIQTIDWKRPARDRFITVKTLRLAVPTNMPKGVFLPEIIERSLDTSGPRIGVRHLEGSPDNSGPRSSDTSSPSTINNHKGRSLTPVNAENFPRRQASMIDAKRQRRPAPKGVREGGQCDLFGNGENS